MSKKGSRNMKHSSLVSFEQAADDEVLQTSVRDVMHVESFRSQTDGEDDLEKEEAQLQAEEELERSLVEQSRNQNKKINGTTDEDKKIVYKADTMIYHAEQLAQDLPWVETLELCKFPLDTFGTNDDLKREVSFYNNSLLGVKEAKGYLQKQNIPYKRPDDYFAEMLKSDSHMAKVKDKLIYEQKKIAAVEERKQSTAYKKVAKQLQQEKLKDRAQSKKDTLEAVKQWKKRSRNNDSTITDGDDGLSSVLEHSSKKHKSDVGSSKSQKRQYKDKKFASGAKNRLAKKNDSKSTNDFKSFNQKRNNDHAGSRYGKAKGSNRPGKNRRQQARSSRS